MISNTKLESDLIRFCQIELMRDAGKTLEQSLEVNGLTQWRYGLLKRLLQNNPAVN